MTNILMGKRNTTKEFCQFRHAAMTRTLSKASGLSEFIGFCLSGMLADIHEYFNCCHQFYFLLSNFSKILHVGFLLLVSI